MSAVLFKAGFPHLDTVVSGLAAAYRPELHFRCNSSLDAGSRQTLEESASDRDCEWVIIDGPVPVSAQQPIFETRVGLRVFVDEATVNRQDAINVAHALAEGIYTDFIGVDRRGDPGTTGILSIVVVLGEAPTYSEVTGGTIVTLLFVIRHGSC